MDATSARLLFFCCHQSHGWHCNTNQTLGSTLLKMEHQGRNWNEPPTLRYFLPISLFLKGTFELEIKWYSSFWPVNLYFVFSIFIALKDGERDGSRQLTPYTWAMMVVQLCFIIWFDSCILLTLHWVTVIRKLMIYWLIYLINFYLIKYVY